MDFNLTDIQKETKAKVREFADREIVPVAAKLDMASEFPKENVKKMARMGLMGMMVPKEYGGQGLDSVCYVIAVEEISRACAAHGVIMSVNNSLGCYPIQTFGTDEQKNQFLPKLAAGEWLGAYALTEPGAGSDPSALSTTAKLEGNEWVLNGSKIFVTTGSNSNILVTYARTKPKDAGYKGISAFIVPTDSPGFKKGQKEVKLGIRASDTMEINFEDCRIPKENMLGEEGRGFNMALATLDGGRIGIASQALGIAQAAYEASLAFAKETTDGGRPLSRNSMVQWKLADMATSVDAARLLLHKAAWTKDNMPRYSTEASTAKLFASETSEKVCRMALEILGVHGASDRYPVERFFRDSRITEIYEGTSEVQRLVIAKTLLS